MYILKHGSVYYKGMIGGVIVNVSQDPNQVAIFETIDEINELIKLYPRQLQKFAVFNLTKTKFTLTKDEK